MNALDLAHLADERDVSRYVNRAGVRLPSVTEVLSLTGCIDLGGIPVERLEQAAERGRIVHHATAELDRDQDVIAQDWLQGYLGAWSNFRDYSMFEPSRIEVSLKSERFSFAGTFDRFGIEKQGRQVLLDIKTSKTMAPWWALQLAGYQVLLEEENEKPMGPIERWSVQLREDGNFSIWRYRSMTDRSDFLAALRVASWLLRAKRYVLP